MASTAMKITTRPSAFDWDDDDVIYDVIVARVRKGTATPIDIAQLPAYLEKELRAEGFLSEDPSEDEAPRAASPWDDMDDVYEDMERRVRNGTASAEDIRDLPEDVKKQLRAHGFLPPCDVAPPSTAPSSPPVQKAAMVPCKWVCPIVVPSDFPRLKSASTLKQPDDHIKPKCEHHDPYYRDECSGCRVADLTRKKLFPFQRKGRSNYDAFRTAKSKTKSEFGHGRSSLRRVVNVDGKKNLVHTAGTLNLVFSDAPVMNDMKARRTTFNIIEQRPTPVVVDIDGTNLMKVVNYDCPNCGFVVTSHPKFGSEYSASVIVDHYNHCWSNIAASIKHHHVASPETRLTEAPLGEAREQTLELLFTAVPAPCKLHLEAQSTPNDSSATSPAPLSDVLDQATEAMDVAASVVDTTRAPATYRLTVIQDPIEVMTAAPDLHRMIGPSAARKVDSSAKPASKSEEQKKKEKNARRALKRKASKQASKAKGTPL